jgi:tRNA(Arg) A34 adenosine deaminase TadA
VSRRYPSVTLRLPDWVDEVIDPDRCYPTTEGRVALAIELSRMNVLHGTGGPFGAAVFDLDQGRLIAPGVNLVISASAAVAHAEIVAVAVAGAALGTFDLGSPALPPTVLVASTEPCAMCFGAVPWSGVRRLVCAARDEDARSVGFDEGPKMIDWQSALESRGIEVIRDVRREAAVEVLRAYAASGGVIYNGRQGD